MRLGSRISLLAGMAATAFAGGLAVSVAKADDIVLKMAVPDWPPTHIMKDLADKYYKAPSGNHVVLQPDFIPWPNYYDRLAASLTSGEKKYQMAVSDSQWLGAFIQGGYYLKLNKFIDAMMRLYVQRNATDEERELFQAFVADEISSDPDAADPAARKKQIEDALVVLTTSTLQSASFVMN